MQTTLKIIVILCTAIAAAFISSEMINIKLYNYWTFALYLSSFVSLLTLWSFFISKLSNKDSLIYYAVASGIMLWLGFTPFMWTPLLFIGLIPLLYIEQTISTVYQGIAKAEVFKFGFIGFMTWNILTTWWVGNSSLAAGIAAIVSNSLLMTIPYVLFHLARHRLGMVLGYVSLVAFWLAFEHIHLRWDFMWPWLNLGNGFASTPQLIQWYEFTGSAGGSLWIWVINILAFRFSIYRTNVSMRIHWVQARIWIPIALIAMPILVSQVLWHDLLHINRVERKNGKEIVVVQPNYEPHYEKFEIPDSEQLPVFFATTRKATRASTDYILFPETSFGNVILSELDYNPSIQALHTFIDSFPNAQLITGLSTYKKYNNTEPRAITAHHGNGIDYESYNSAEQFTANSPQVNHYIKSKLVPGIERLPYFQYLGFLAPFTESFGGTASSLGIGEPVEFWNAQHTNAVGTLICYESIFGELAAEHVRKGANMLFIITNDGWWGNTPGYQQHLDIGRLRAIETRRPIARAANTGASAFIDTRGTVILRTAYNERTALRCTLYPNDKITFYVRYGDYITRFALLLSVLSLLYILYKSLRNK